MIVPVFKLQIASVETGMIVSRYGGEPLEVELADAVMAKLNTQPIGLFSSRATVEAAIRQALQDVCMDLKMETVSVVAPEMASLDPGRVPGAMRRRVRA